MEGEGAQQGGAAYGGQGAPGSPEGAAHGPHRSGNHHSRAHGDRGTAHYPVADVTAGRGFAGPGTRAWGGNTINALSSDGVWRACTRSRQPATTTSARRPQGSALT